MAEIKVNTDPINGTEPKPKIAALNYGGFVVTWANVGDGSGQGVYAQIFNSDKSKNGSEFLVNTFTQDDQTNPVILSLSNGNFIIAWESFGQEAIQDDWGIYAQIFLPSGSKVGSEFQVNQAFSGNQIGPIMSEMNGEKFVVGFKSGTTGKATIFDISGSLIKEINGFSDFYQAKIDGGFIQSFEFSFALVWAVSDANGARLYTSDYKSYDSPTPLLYGPYRGGYFKILDMGDGSGKGVYGQFFYPTLNERGGSFRINSYTNEDQLSPNFVELTDGEILIAWESSWQDGDGFGIYAQQYAPNGNKIGGEFKVNNVTEGDQKNPEIAALTNNEVVVTWSSATAVAGVYDVKLESFDIFQGITVGQAEHDQINYDVLNYPSAPAISKLTGGGYVVVWNDIGDNDSNINVYAQIFNSNSVKVGSQLRVNIPDGYDHIFPAVSGLNNDKFIVAWQSGKDSKLYAQKYDYSGGKLGGVINVGDARDYEAKISIKHISQGAYAIGWGDEDDIVHKLYNDANNLIAGPVTMNKGGSLDIEFLDWASKYVVTHTDTTQLSNKMVNYIYSSINGSAIATLNYIIGNSAEYINGKSSSVSIFGNNQGHVTVYEYYPSYIQKDIYAKLFENFEPTETVRVNSYNAGDQENPDICAMPNGEILVVWQSLYGSGISAQQFSKNATTVMNPLNEEFDVYNISSAHRVNPAVECLDNGKVIVVSVGVREDNNGLGLYHKALDIMTPIPPSMITNSPTSSPTLNPTNAPTAGPTNTPTTSPVVLEDNLANNNKMSSPSGDTGQFALSSASDLDVGYLTLVVPVIMAGFMELAY